MEPLQSPVRDVPADERTSAPTVRRRRSLGTRIASLTLFAVLGTGAFTLWSFKERSTLEAMSAAAAVPEPTESVRAVAAESVEYRRSTVAIGTVLALRSITLRNDLPGTVAEVRLESGRIVEAGEVLIALDVSVETAELEAQEAEIAAARSALQRLLRAGRAAPAIEVDRARAEYDIAVAQAARTRAIIEKKTLTAPFRARVGLADVHVGQYLQQGTELTTLQGVDDAVHVDFAVTQEVAGDLAVGETVRVTAPDIGTTDARIVAIDARVDAETRNAMVRARLESAALAPGASVRVEVPVGERFDAVAVPTDAVRKGPEGTHVFVAAPDASGRPRAHYRRVEIGPTVGSDTLVRSGLEPGEQVATTGSFKLRDGVLIAIQEASSQGDLTAR